MTIAFARMFGQFFVFFPAQFMRCKVHAKWGKVRKENAGSGGSDWQAIKAQLAANRTCKKAILIFRCQSSS